MQYAEKITLCEVGPRDGLQNEAKLLTAEEKTELIEQMIGAGFKVIEVGSFVSPKAVPQMANTDEVLLALGQREGVQLRAGKCRDLIRELPKGQLKNQVKAR